MDETTSIQPVADPIPAAAPADAGEAPGAAQADPAPDAAPAVAALDTETAAPAAADPTPDAGDPAPADPAPVDADGSAQPDEPHPVLAACRQELDKIANMPAHIWRQIEAAFERVAAKL